MQRQENEVEALNDVPMGGRGWTVKKVLITSLEKQGRKIILNRETKGKAEVTKTLLGHLSLQRFFSVT